jgi:hypothetical protein
MVIVKIPFPLKGRDEKEMGTIPADGPHFFSELF